MDDATPSNDQLPVAQPQQPRKRNRSSKKQMGGYSAPKLSDAYRGRQLLNADTIREMHAAFRVGGRAAIDKVMKNQPAIFLKPIRHLRGLAGGMRLRRAGIFCPFSGKRCVGQFLRSA
jgi:hypothetical protein